MNINDLIKLPPQNTDIEEAILGAMMLERDAVDQCLSILKPDDFYKTDHKHIFTAFSQLHAKGDPVDIKTTTHQLRVMKQLDRVGGAFYVTNLTTKVNSAANIETHARIVKEMAMKRELLHMCSKLQDNCYDDSTNVFDLIDQADHVLSNISTQSSDIVHLGDPKNILAIIDDAVNATKKREAGGVTGIPSGFPKIDRYTGGWQNTDLIILAARPGMGKTAFVISSVKHQAVDLRIPVGIFSLEMVWRQLAIRLMSDVVELESDKFRNGDIKSFEIEQLMFKAKKIEGAPIYVDDTPGMSIMQMKSKAKMMKKKYGIKKLYVDYLQLAEANEKTGMNREQAIAEVSRGLKGIAKELDIPVTALAQLSRAVETRGGSKRPILSDLRESGSIEQDADIVMFAFRPEYYGIIQDESGMPTQGIGEIIFAKNRHGKLGYETLKFIGKFTKWADDEPAYAIPDNQTTLGFVRDPTESGQKEKDDNPDEMPF